MGEEAKQVEKPKEEANKVEEKKEEKAEETKEEPAVEKKEGEAKPPPAPFVLSVDLHCMGCAKKIERSIMKIRGVEGVVIDMGRNQVTIKGVVEPQAVCTKIINKTKRPAQVLSPLPAAEGESIPEVVASQVSGSTTTVELSVNMHCEACAEQLNRKILKMKGVRTAETDISSGKVRVTGTMDPNKLVEYVYRRTKKQAKIVPQPEPEKPAEEAKPEEKKEEVKPPAEDDAKPEQKKEDDPVKKDNGGGEKPAAAEGEKKEGGSDGSNEGGGPTEGVEIVTDHHHQDQMMMMQRMMYQQYYYYYNNNYQQPLYVIDRIPPPQLFSDENPNAYCSIT